MDFEEMTIGDAKKLAAMFGGGAEAQNPFCKGECYLIRTVTNYWTGRVLRTIGNFLVLGEAAWIADTGRFSEATTILALNEVEPREGEVIISLGSVVDAVEWTSELPTKRKP